MEDVAKLQSFNNRRSPNYASIYANNVAYSMNVFDITLIFGEVDDFNQETNVITVDQKVKVMMAPTQAKLLRDALIKVVADYEQKFGEVVDVNTFQPKPTE